MRGFHTLYRMQLLFRPSPSANSAPLARSLPRSLVFRPERARAVVEQQLSLLSDHGHRRERRGRERDRRRGLALSPSLSLSAAPSVTRAPAVHQSGGREGGRERRKRSIPLATATPLCCSLLAAAAPSRRVAEVVILRPLAEFLRFAAPFLKFIIGHQTCLNRYLKFIALEVAALLAGPHWVFKGG